MLYYGTEQTTVKELHKPITKLLSLKEQFRALKINKIKIIYISRFSGFDLDSLSALNTCQNKLQSIKPSHTTLVSQLPSKLRGKCKLFQDTNLGQPGKPCRQTALHSLCETRGLTLTPSHSLLGWHSLVSSLKQCGIALPSHDGQSISGAVFGACGGSFSYCCFCWQLIWRPWWFWPWVYKAMGRAKR